MPDFGIGEAFLFAAAEGAGTIGATDQQRGRLNLIRHLLDSIPYKKVEVDLPEIPKAAPRPKGAQEGFSMGQTIPSHY